jgi:hypothetical protein
MGNNWQEIEARNREAQATQRNLLAGGVLVALAFFGWTQYGGEKSTTEEPSPASEATVIQVPAMQVPTEVEPPVARQGSTPPTKRERYVGVYECIVNGQRVVSDRPCAPDAQTRTLVIDQPDPREVARQREELWQAQKQAGGSAAPRSSSSSRSSYGSVGAPSNELACAAVDRQIELLNAQMRQGYSAPQGERYREQWHALKQRRYDLGCGR